MSNTFTQSPITICLNTGSLGHSTRDTLLLPLSKTDEDSVLLSKPALVAIASQDEREIRDVTSGDGGPFGSGSGATSITPTTTPTVPPTDSTLPSVYIEIVLDISFSDYLKQQREIEDGILQVLQEFRSTSRKRDVEGQSISVELDRERSSNKTSSLRVFFRNEETGEVDIESTAELYAVLVSNRDEFLLRLANTIDIVSPKMHEKRKTALY